MSEIKTPIEFLNEEYLQELGEGSLSHHVSWNFGLGVLISTYQAKQIIDYANKLKEQNEKLKEAINEYAIDVNTLYTQPPQLMSYKKMIEALKSCEP